MAFPSPSDDARPAAVPPRDTAPAPRMAREGLSIQTLVIASIASAAAAIIVSRIWDKGTIIASAMTPVVVAVVSEMLRRPIESEVVRRPVRAVGSVTASRRTWRRGEGRPPSGRTPNVMAPPPTGVDQGLRQREEGVEPGPVRVYSSGSNRSPAALGGRGRRNLKIAVATGLVGFVVAALALTLPELIFGGSVTGGTRHTTYFGGGTQPQSKDKAKDGATSGGKPDSTTKDQTTTAPDPAATDQTTTNPPAGAPAAPGSGGTPPTTDSTQPPPTTAPPSAPTPAPPGQPTPTPTP